MRPPQTHTLRFGLQLHRLRSVALTKLSMHAAAQLACLTTPRDCTGLPEPDGTSTSGGEAPAPGSHTHQAASGPTRDRSGASAAKTCDKTPARVVAAAPSSDDSIGQHPDEGLTSGAETASRMLMLSDASVDGHCMNAAKAMAGGALAAAPVLCAPPSAVVQDRAAACNAALPAVGPGAAQVRPADLLPPLCATPLDRATHSPAAPVVTGAMKGRAQHGAVGDTGGRGVDIVAVDRRRQELQEERRRLKPEPSAKGAKKRRQRDACARRRRAIDGELAELEATVMAEEPRQRQARGRRDAWTSRADDALRGSPALAAGPARPSAMLPSPLRPPLWQHGAQFPSSFTAPCPCKALWPSVGGAVRRLGLGGRSVHSVRSVIGWEALW